MCLPILKFSVLITVTNKYAIIKITKDFIQTIYFSEDDLKKKKKNRKRFKQ